ncbi:MAG TPA: glycosyl hydrolase-related protein [Anaerolineae bacterium]|nr:glycosyl hydrolase-related protein [Anaerolineae bacterium]
MKRIPWNEEQPGHFEVVAVHHCGIRSAGHHIHTIQMVDVATGWTEQVATLGRGYMVMEDGLCRNLARLPFPVLEIHPDNGSEGLIARFYNTEDHEVQAEVGLHKPFRKVLLVDLNEEQPGESAADDKRTVSPTVGAKEIVTIRIEFNS